MINVLKKYWILILIIGVAVNFLGFNLINESIRISDALEHAESDKVIERLRHKDFFYTLFIDFVLIIDFLLLIFVPYLVVKRIVKK